MPTTEEIAKRKPSAEKSTLILPSLGAMQDSSLRLEIGAKTHVGKVRGNNEDQYLIVRAKKLVEVLDCSLPEAQCPPLPDCEC